MALQRRVVKRNESEFPPQLMGVEPEVERLYFRGEWEGKILARCVAVIGSRRMSRYGKQVVAELVPRLVRAGYTTVSGGMYGIDIEVHRVTQEAGGKTIAVLGWGIEYQAETEMHRMSERIIDSGGLVISEWGGTEPPQLFMFPRRNRIVTGLAEAVIVVEAAKKSGSLNSANWGRRQGKKVWAVPGSIFSQVSRGTNELIAKGKAEELSLTKLEEWLGEQANKVYTEKGPQNQLKLNLTKSEREIITQLSAGGPQGVSELARALSRSAGEVGAVLIVLEMRGVVAKEHGLWTIGNG